MQLCCLANTFLPERPLNANLTLPAPAYLECATSLPFLRLCRSVTLQVWHVFLHGLLLPGVVAREGGHRQGQHSVPSNAASQPVHKADVSTGLPLRAAVCFHSAAPGRMHFTPINCHKTHLGWGFFTGRLSHEAIWSITATSNKATKQNRHKLWDIVGVCQHQLSPGFKLCESYLFINRLNANSDRVTSRCYDFANRYCCLFFFTKIDSLRPQKQHYVVLPKNRVWNHFYISIAASL